MSRFVRIVSDLHLGGELRSGDHAVRPMCQQAELLADTIQDLALRDQAELVINGDFVDFLAEVPEGEERPRAFIDDARVAVAALQRAFDGTGTKRVFDALSKLLASGHRLTILLGNHDLELCLPPVREALRERLGAGPAADLGFVYDGEAYVVGDALIEHGNRYDAFNVVDHDALRRVRSLVSRGQDVTHARFTPPPGSWLVANVLEDLRRVHPWVELLKPEGGAVVPLLLFLDPGVRGEFRRKFLALLRHLAPVLGHGIRKDGVPRRRGEIGGPADEDLEAVIEHFAAGDKRLAETMRELTAQAPPELPAREGPMTRRGDIGGMMAGVTQALTFTELLLRPNQRALLRLLERLRDDDGFAIDRDSTPYARHARTLAADRFRFVVFGHTHLAKAVHLGDDRWYLNTGTWADLMRVPEGVLHGGEEERLARLEAFLKAMQGDLESVAEKRPTYVDLECDGGRVRRASLKKATADEPMGVVEVRN